MLLLYSSTHVVYDRETAAASILSHLTNWSIVPGLWWISRKHNTRSEVRISHYIYELTLMVVDKEVHASFWTEEYTHIFRYRIWMTLLISNHRGFFKIFFCKKNEALPPFFSRRVKRSVKNPFAVGSRKRCRIGLATHRVPRSIIVFVPRGEHSVYDAITCERPQSVSQPAKRFLTR